MATAFSLNNYQLRESLQNWNQTHLQNQVPDFITREKTAFVWSKIYITLTNGDVTFTELNFIQRVFRYLFGWYAETILESATRAKVTLYIHSLMTDRGFQEVLKFHKQMKAASLKGDYNALEQGMVQFRESAAAGVQSDLDEMLQRVRSPSTKVVRGYESDYISEEFLNEVLSLAAVYGKTPQSEQIWKGIELGLQQNTDVQKRKLNVALFRELIRIIEGNGAVAQVPRTEDDLIKVPCQEIKVSAAIQGRIEEGIKLPDFIPSPSSWADYLHNYRALVEFNHRLTDLREDVKTMLLDEEADLTRKLEDKLKALGAREDLVAQYLADKERLAERLFFHAEVTKDDSPFSMQSRQVLDDLSSLQKKMAHKINKEYQSLPNGGRGDCFFLSCDHLAAREGSNWRKDIAAHLLLNRSRYEGSVLQRIATDNRVPCDANFEKYCDWIEKEGSWGGQPEVEAFSEMTHRTVIIVQNQSGGTFEWGGIFNLAYGGDPLIFKNHGAYHYEAMNLFH